MSEVQAFGILKAIDEIKSNYGDLYILIKEGEENV